MRTVTNPRLVLWTLVALFVGINLVMALLPPSLSFWDEQVYNTASTRILEGQGCPVVYNTVGTSDIPISTSCNYEHPPLVKALDALTLYLFGSVRNSSAPGTLVWRIASLLSFRTVQLVTGALSIPLVYTIAYEVSANRRLALLSALFLFLEPLYGLFSRTDYLDVPMIAFALCAYAAYFGAWRLGRVSNYTLSGIFLGLSVLSKETGVFLSLPLLIYDLSFVRTTPRQKVERILSVVGAEAVAIAAGLQLFDSLAGTPFPTFLDHIVYIGSFAAQLVCPNQCNSPGQNPWYFLPTSNYWMLGVSYNPLVLWSAFLWVPIGMFLVLRGFAYRGGKVDRESRLFVFAALLLASTLLSNELLFLGGRIVWIWYFLPAAPGLAFGEAFLLTRTQIPGRIRLLLACLGVVGYLLAFVIGPDLLLYD